MTDQHPQSSAAGDGLLPEIRVGQIWREVDPRFNRWVRIKEVHPSGRRSILIQTAVRNGNGGWDDAPRSRKAWADRTRFNGKHSGYEFTEEGF